MTIAHIREETFRMAKVTRWLLTLALVFGVAIGVGCLAFGIDLCVKRDWSGILLLIGSGWVLALSATMIEPALYPERVTVTVSPGGIRFGMAEQEHDWSKIGRVRFRALRGRFDVIGVDGELIGSIEKELSNASRAVQIVLDHLKIADVRCSFGRRFGIWFAFEVILGAGLGLYVTWIFRSHVIVPLMLVSMMIAALATIYRIDVRQVDLFGDKLNVYSVLKTATFGRDEIAAVDFRWGKNPLAVIVLKSGRRLPLVSDHLSGIDLYQAIRNWLRSPETKR